MLTLRPAMKAVVCDLYREDGPGGGAGRFLTLPVEVAYARQPDDAHPPEFPSLRPKALSGHPIGLTPLARDDIDPALVPCRDVS